MACALCLEEAELRNSHVIPEFMYTPLYNDKHQFHVLSSTESTRAQKLQRGLREKLLCDCCETKIGQYERYASHVFNGTVSVKSSRTGDLVHIAGLSYKEFKLFGLSIVWRASVSKLEFFRNVSLGPHEETIRLMLLTESPGRPESYGMFLAPIVAGDIDVKELIVQPTHARMDGHYCYRFVFGGLVWVFVISGHKVRGNLKQAFVNEVGEMLMLVSELKDVTFIVNSMKAIGSRK